MIGIQVIERKHGHFPAKFRLANSKQVINVDAIERCWTEMPETRGSVKYHFKVRCGKMHYFLSEDTTTAWCDTTTDRRPLTAD